MKCSKSRVMASLFKGIPWIAIGAIGAAGVTSLSMVDANPAGGAQPLLAASASATSSAISSSDDVPRVFAPTQPRVTYTRYPWKTNIVTTIFWIGEEPTPKNPTPNDKSSWDVAWVENYGGYDDPDPQKRGWDYTPTDFTPGQNPFYVALPYNDVLDWKSTKPEAKRVIPWFHQRFVAPGRSVCKGQWVAIRRGSKICYAQWEDCGPFETTDYDYVFGDRSQPRTTSNGGAGLDVSPAVRDYLGMKSGERLDWRFVDLREVAPGPWQRYGANNDFVQMREEQMREQQDRIAKLREARDAWLQEQRLP